MYKIVATDAAEKDLSAIRDYLLNEFCNPLSVEDLFDEIRRAYEVLVDNPYAFEECRDSRLQRKGYRKCVVGGYLFVYRVEDDGNGDGIIHVIRYFHGLQNYITQL